MVQGQGLLIILWDVSPLVLNTLIHTSSLP